MSLNYSIIQVLEFSNFSYFNCLIEWRGPGLGGAHARTASRGSCVWDPLTYGPPSPVIFSEKLQLAAGTEIAHFSKMWQGM